MKENQAVSKKCVDYQLELDKGKLHCCSKFDKS